MRGRKAGMVTECLEEGGHAVKAAAVESEGNAFSLFQKVTSQIQLSVGQIL